VKIFGYDFSVTRAAAAAPGPQASVTYRTAGTSAEIEALLRGDGSGGFVGPEQAMKVAAAYRSITLISGVVATMPLALKRRVGEDRLDASDHPLSNVLTRRPNRWQTPSQFRRQLQAHLLLRGNGYAMKARAGNRIAGLIPMMPDRVRVEQLDDFSLVYHYTTKRGAMITLPQTDVFHLVGHTLDGVTGLSPISCARETIGVALAMQQHAKAIFENGARMSGSLEHPGELSSDAQARLRESLDKFRAGGEMDGKVIILEEGMKYERIGLSMADAQFIESQAANRAEVFMFYGVPPDMAGDTANGKNISATGGEQKTQGFVSFTMEDWLTTWEQTIARDLIAENEPQLYPRFNRAALVRGDIRTRYAAYAIARQWGLNTIDELRALEDTGPLPDGAGANAFVGGNAQRTNAGDPFADDPADKPTGDPADA
jgi:HK97 family phage portal protein